MMSWIVVASYPLRRIRDISAPCSAFRVRAARRSIVSTTGQVHDCRTSGLTCPIANIARLSFVVTDEYIVHYHTDRPAASFFEGSCAAAHKERCHARPHRYSL